MNQIMLTTNDAENQSEIHKEKQVLDFLIQWKIPAVTRCQH